MASSMVVSALLSGVFQVLFDRLASRQLMSFFRRDQTLPTKLRIVLLTVHAVLIDAEEQQITNLRVKEWVKMLEDAVYRAEDLLDKIDTWQRKSEADAKVKGKSKVNGNEVNKEIESKLTEILEKLDLLAKQRDLLNLKQSVNVKPPPMSPTTSLVDESEVFGRNNDKEELKRILLAADAPENRILAIVGMGGVGKTTLAQLLYNDSEVKRRFHLRAWAYVSEEFDVFKVTRTIYESVTQRNCNIRDLNLLQIKLQKRLEGKRFLLILDNIWNEKFMDWDLLSKPLKNGASGGTIVVTTRNQHVAALMGAFFTYPLAHLSDDACWSLFAKHAFWSSNYEGPFKEIGEKIAKKCKGLPLAAKTLGGLLQSKEEKEEWLRILNSNIWDLPEDNSILPALQLSYYYLPSHLKRCFNYCSMFPKGYKFNKDRLILLWMAEGFLRSPTDKETMEQLGSEYFHELLSRSFFQQLSGRETCFVMHDLINDLALFTSGEFYSKFEDGKPSGLLKKERHVVFLADKLDGPDKFRDSICKFKDLRTFLPLEGNSNTSQASGICSVFCEEWLPKLKHLRVLSLSGYAYIKLRDSLGKLIHLRYLDLSRTLIEKLPSSTCLLFNLQTLLLSGCHQLTVLPAESLGLLINLRYLDFSQTAIRVLPSSTCSLTNLQTLLLSKCHRLTVLPEEIGRLSNLRDFDLSQTEITKLPSSTCSLTNLQTLLLSKCHHLTVLPEKIEGLSNLRCFDLSQTEITELPSSICSLTNLQVLLLPKCHRLTALPEEIGRLSNLRDFDLSQTGITKLPSSTCSLTNLQTLLLSKCHRLTVLPEEIGRLSINLRDFDLSQTEITELPSSTCSLTNLQTLLLSKCPRLTVLPEEIGQLSNLCYLDLSQTEITQLEMFLNKFADDVAVQVSSSHCVTRRDWTTQ